MILKVVFLFTSDKGGGICNCPQCLSIYLSVSMSIYLSVSKITQKCIRGFGWNFARRQMSGHERTDQLLSPIWIIVRIQEPDLHQIFQFQQDYSNTHAWIWMKCCVSTDVVTWTNWSTFEPYLDHSLDPGTRFTTDFSISARLLRNACIDLDEILRVDRCLDIDELINFWAWSGS